MQQYGSKFFARSPPLSPQKVKIQLYQSMVMLHIKVPDPLDGLRWWNQNVKIKFFLEHGHVAYQIKGITDAAT